jgi:hypothetical protein
LGLEKGWFGKRRDRKGKKNRGGEEKRVAERELFIKNLEKGIRIKFC